MSAEKQGEVIANTGAEFVSAEGTWLLKKGERVLSKKEGADQAYYKGVIPYLIIGDSNKEAVAEHVSDADLYRMETPVMFDRANREHVLALKEAAERLLHQIDHGGEPVRFAVGPYLLGDRELRLAAVDEVSAGMSTVKLDFLIPL